ncbi:MAG: hypothetical protein IJZ89_02085 [Clostridia bacterium]|nr:hypothetical protein [Clostridia bacterium]
MKLRIFALLLTLILALSCFVSCGNTGDGKDTDTAVDSGTEAFTGEAVDTDPIVEGGTLSVVAEVVGTQLVASVKVDGNPGLAAFNIKLNYDNTKICPVELTDSELVDPTVIASNIQQDPEAVSELTYATAFYANPTDFTGDGVLFTITFDILEGATGETELSLTCDKGGNTNQKFEDIIFTLEGCTVTLG